MLTIPSRKVVAIGGAMVEMAPIGGGPYRRGYAGDTFNTVWHMAQLLGDTAHAGFVTALAATAVRRWSMKWRPTGWNLRSDPRSRAQHGALPDRARRRRAELPLLARHLGRPPLGRRSGRPRRGGARGRPDPPLGDYSRHSLGRRARILFRLLAEARTAGTIVAFDPNIRPRLWSSHGEVQATTSRMLSLTDIALPSFDDEASNWPDATPSDTINRLLAIGVREVAVKNGAGSVHVHSEEADQEVATPPVDGIRDTTGAGDAFNAGYLSARLLGSGPVDAVAAGQRLSAEVLRVWRESTAGKGSR